MSSQLFFLANYLTRTESFVAEVNTLVMVANELLGAYCYHALLNLFSFDIDFKDAFGLL